MNKSQLHSQVVRCPAYRSLSPRARSVFQALWSFAGGGEACEDGRLGVECRARVETVADADGCSVRTASRAVEEIEAAGLLERRRTGRASVFTLFAEAPAATPGAGRDRSDLTDQIGHPCPIRSVTGGVSDRSPVADRAAPSICIHQDQSFRTTTPGAVVGGGEPAQAWRQPDLDGAAAVAFEMLTGRGCPAAVRFESPGDRSVLRRLLVALAEARSPVVELTRYAVDRAREPGLRSPRGMVIATLREPDFHAVYEHAERLRASQAARARAEASRAREAAEASAAARAVADAAREADLAVAAASPAEISAAVEVVRGAADPFLARRMRGLSAEQLLARPHTRGLIVEVLGQSPTAGATPAQP